MGIYSHFPFIIAPTGPAGETNAAATVTTLQSSASLTDAINTINQIIQNLQAAGLMNS